MTPPHQDPASPAPDGSVPAKLDYATKSEPPPLSVNVAVKSFNVGALGGWFAFMVFEAITDPKNFADSPLWGCGMVLNCLLLTAVQGVVATISITIRRWATRDPLRLRGHPAAFFTGLLGAAFAAGIWLMMWRAGVRPLEGTGRSLMMWAAPLGVVPAVAPVWLLDRYP